MSSASRTPMPTPPWKRWRCASRPQAPSPSRRCRRRPPRARRARAVRPGSTLAESGPRFRFESVPSRAMRSLPARRWWWRIIRRSTCRAAGASAPWRAATSWRALSGPYEQTRHRGGKPPGARAPGNPARRAHGRVGGDERSRAPHQPLHHGARDAGLLHRDLRCRGPQHRAGDQQPDGAHAGTVPGAGAGRAPAGGEVGGGRRRHPQRSLRRQPAPAGHRHLPAGVRRRPAHRLRRRHGPPRRRRVAARPAAIT